MLDVYTTLAYRRVALGAAPTAATSLVAVLFPRVYMLMIPPPAVPVMVGGGPPATTAALVRVIFTASLTVILAATV